MLKTIKRVIIICIYNIYKAELSPWTVLPSLRAVKDPYRPDREAIPVYRVLRILPAKFFDPFKRKMLYTIEYRLLRTFQISLLF